MNEINMLLDGKFSCFPVSTTSPMAVGSKLSFGAGTVEIQSLVRFEDKFYAKAAYLDTGPKAAL